MESPRKISESRLLRQKAEEVLNSDIGGLSRKNYESDTLKLVHELQVYQIELELQNNELLLAKERAEKAAEKYTELYDFAPSGYFTLSEAGQIIELNLTGAQLLGKERSLLINTQFDFFVSDESKPVFKIFLEKIFKSQTTESCEVSVKLKDRLLVYLYITGIITESGESCHLTAVNITDRKKAEDESRRLQSDLISAQLKLSIALKNGNIGIWEWNLATDEMVWDDRMEKMFGLLPGTFGRTYTAFENLLNEEDLQHVRNAVKRTLKKNMPFETIFRIKDEKGKTKHISSKGLINYDRNMKPVSLTGVCFDVTAMNESTRKLVLKLNEELLRSNKELQNFAYAASHDLQEPLRMVSSFTQLLALQYDDKLDKKAHEYIQYAVDGAKRMYELLNGLLAYSRIQTKRNIFKMVDLNKVLDNVKKSLMLKIDESSAVIKSEELPVVYADESQMSVLFLNLISNSIKFRTEPPQISISAKSQRDKYIFSVKDKGIGIDPQYKERIFLIFQRLNHQDQYDGLGIGLALCKRIVERHGGNIWVESELGKGSVFYFSIPKKIHKVINPEYTS